MGEIKQTKRAEAFNMLVGILVVVALGAGTATAAISIGHENNDNPALHALAINPGATVMRAYGRDDEDCVKLTRRVATAGGKYRVVTQLECAE